MARERDRCRRCFRLARHGRIYCDVHLGDLSPYAATSVSELVKALEELTEASHALLWDWESRRRRDKRAPRVNGPEANLLRGALRYAQDVLLPSENGR